MKDVFGMLADLRRPKLLIEAARIAARDYRREPCLTRLLGPAPARPGAAVMQLMALEGELDDIRRSGAAGYSVRRHVEVLAAMMGEACLMREAGAPSAPASAPGAAGSHGAAARPALRPVS